VRISSASGCVRVAPIDSRSHSYPAIVPKDCDADKHESLLPPSDVL